MDTVQKGNKFENLVFKYIKQELYNDNFLVSPRNSEIFQKKGYYSKDRQSNIITDISIETFLPNIKNFGLLIIIECKDYKKNVPINDIEEFYAKVQQIAGINVKGIFVTTAKLQNGALKYAKSKGIGVLHLPPESVK